MISRFNLKRRNNRQNKKNFIILVFFAAIITFNVGYATIQTTLNINGNIGLKSSIWDVYFDNLSVKEECDEIEGNSAVLSDDLKTVVFTIRLNYQHNYYEFEVDTVNDGGVDAMIGGEIQVKGIPDYLKSFINVKITYNDEIEIKPNYLLKSGTKERIKVRVESTNLEKVPEGTILDLTLEIPYMQSTSDAIEKPNGINLNKLIRTNAINDKYINFGAISSDENGKGVYLRNGTENDENPIYYYRGEVYNNNLVYANYCWKIVRTTETGGTKIIFNGPVGAKNTCTVTTSTASRISTSKFNNKEEAKHVGYTYEEDGVQVDSVIKEVIDTWYETNILNKYDDYLEDTVWCNDRSIYNISGSYTYFDGYRRIYKNHYPSLVCSNPADRYTLKSDAKKFNSKLDGNKLLDYPIALITADEAALSGGYYYQSDGSAKNTKFYLYNNAHFWTLTPSEAYGTENLMLDVNFNGALAHWDTTQSFGVRPSVSLAPDTLVTVKGIGDAGTAENPYIVE